jgi:spermidine/putrescine transport system substrate-binding protein
MSQPTARPAAGLTRRALLGRMGALAGAGILGPTLLAACGSDKKTSTGGSTSKALWFENWPAYIDEETVDLFKQDSGLDFKYTESFNDNNEYFAKVQTDLAAGRSIGPDIIPLTRSPTRRTSCPSSRTRVGIPTASSASRGSQA